MTDYVFAIFKVGSQQSQFGIKDGMLVDWIDPDAYKPIFSDHFQKVFAIIRVPRIWVPKLKDACQPSFQNSESRIIPEDGKSRSGYIDFKELQTALSMSGLEDALRGPGKVEPLDGMSISQAIIKDAKLKIFDHILDRNAVSSGTYTVGSGGDYATWAAALADIAASLTGNLTFNQITAVTEAGTATVATNINAFTLTLDSSTPHLGNPTGGLLVNINHNGIGLNVNGTSGPAGSIINVKNLYLKRLVAGSSGLDTALHHDCGDTDVTINWNNILIDSGGLNTSGVRTANNSALVNAWNVISWDTGINAAWILSAINSSSILENCVSLDCQNGFNAGSNAVTIRNCVAFNAVNNDFQNISGATGRNNASEDATAANANWSVGTGNTTGITPANEFVSTSDASANFMKVQAGFTCDNGGTAVSIAGNTTGIRGNPRPGPDTLYSIGADELAEATTGPKMYQYRRRRNQ